MRTPPRPSIRDALLAGWGRISGRGGRFAAFSHPARMDWLDLMQWPAFAVTIVASWLVASDARQRRLWGFGVFLVSNALWIAWGWHDAAWALVALQGVLILTNIRGVADNRGDEAAGSEPA